MAARKIRLTAIGDKVAGRPDLLNLSSKVENKQMTVDNKSVSVSLRDTGAMEELDRLQPAVYRDTDCFLLCYSVNVKDSFENIESKWCQEIKTLCPNKPFVLVGYKSDGTQLVLSADAQKLAPKIGAATVLQYSSTEDLETMLSGAVKAAMSHTPKREAVQANSPGMIDSESGGGGGGCCSCFKRCFQKKDSSYNFTA